MHENIYFGSSCSAGSLRCRIKGTKFIIIHEKKYKSYTLNLLKTEQYHDYRCWQYMPSIFKYAYKYQEISVKNNQAIHLSPSQFLLTHITKL